MSNFSYMSIWLVAVPTQADAGSQAYRYLWMQGQTNGSLASEQATQFKDLNLGQLSSLFTEFVVIDKIIIQYTAANWTIQEVDKLTGNRVNPGSTPAGSYLSDVSVTAPLTGNGTAATPLAIPAATTSVDGYLASTDWTTFNSKQPQLNGTGLVRMTGTTVNYDNSTYLTGTKVDSFNTRTGAVTLTSSDVTAALTYTPYDSANPAGYTTNLGTVTSVAALTLGTTGTDLSSTVADGTTTPVITLNVPTASASNRGALSAADWSTFNGKQTAYTLLTTFGSLANAPGYLYNDGSGGLSYAAGSSGGVSSFNTRTGAVTLTSGDVTGALTYTPINKAGDTGIGDMSMGALTTSGILTTNGGMNMGRSNSASTGILHYSTTYTAWQTYMTTPGVASGVSGTITAPTGTYVTDWGFRIFIENRPGFGWTWESGEKTSTFPSIVAELSSLTGDFRTIGSISGTSFNSITGLASDAPLMDGTAAVGTSTLTARQDHVHPVDTSRQAQLNGNGFVKVSGTTVSYSNSINPRVTTITSSSTPTPNGDNTDLFTITALAAAATIAAPTGTPVNGQKLMMRIKDNGTAQTLAWNSIYVAGGVALPATTVASKILTLGFMYNTDNGLNKWCLIASSQEV
jgi:hypothetical protein